MWQILYATALYAVSIVFHDRKISNETRNESLCDSQWRTLGAAVEWKSDIGIF